MMKPLRGLRFKTIFHSYYCWNRSAVHFIIQINTKNAGGISSITETDWSLQLETPEAFLIE